MAESEYSMRRKQYTPAFVGISNWDIDASKLNRNVYLARPDLDLQDLMETSKTIIQYQMTNVQIAANKKEEIENLSNLVSKTYRDFRQEQIVKKIFG